jgi:hypothetical protein
VNDDGDDDDNKDEGDDVADNVMEENEAELTTFIGKKPGGGSSTFI